MKKMITMIFLALGMITLVGCENDDVILDPRPAAPQGVFSVTGDGEVHIWWNGPYEADISEYIIYRSNDDITYDEIARRTADANPSLDLLMYEYIDTDVVNGNVYYYAVETVDIAGQYSGLSAEDVWDTPRPQGTVTLYTADIDASRSGFLFEAEAVVSNSLGDIFIQTINESFYISSRLAGTYIMDVGYISYDPSFDDPFDSVSVSPSVEVTIGWSNQYDVELIEGHTYVIWLTEDTANNFAKMRADIVGDTRVIMQWAYQTDRGNPQLKPATTVASGGGQ